MNLNRGGGFAALGSDAADFGQRFAQRAKFPAPVLSQAPPRGSLLPTQHGKRGVSSFSLGEKARMRAVSAPHHNQTRTFGQSSRNGIFKSRQTRICCRCSQGIPRTIFDQPTIFYRAKLFALVSCVVIQHNHDFAGVITGSPVKIILMAGERWR